MYFVGIMQNVFFMIGLLKIKKPLGLKGLYPTEYFNADARSKIFLFISVFSSLFMLGIIHFGAWGSVVVKALRY